MDRSRQKKLTRDTISELRFCGQNFCVFSIRRIPITDLELRTEEEQKNTNSQMNTVENTGEGVVQIFAKIPWGWGEVNAFWIKSLGGAPFSVLLDFYK